jgi:hypothetical protein
MAWRGRRYRREEGPDEWRQAWDRQGDLRRRERARGGKDKEQGNQQNRAHANLEDLILLRDVCSGP